MRRSRSAHALASLANNVYCPGGLHSIAPQGLSVLALKVSSHELQENEDFVNIKIPTFKSAQKAFDNQVKKFKRNVKKQTKKINKVWQMTSSIYASDVNESNVDYLTSNTLSCAV